MESVFEIYYNGFPASVQEYRADDERVFNITFTDKRRPLVITVSITRDGKKWWTSIPQGRQKEAEEVGKLIAIYIRAKRKEQ